MTQTSGPAYTQDNTILTYFLLFVKIFLTKNTLFYKMDHYSLKNKDYLLSIFKEAA